ncbi:MAG TPA: PEP-utilizing enzyme [Solirubrobacteraceae bacterium]|nr:PEP-utilizing enzyme [Solirubrobacteraceae bacterium]
MAQARTETALDLEAPGPGTWEMDPVHFPRPMTRYWTEVHPDGFRRGTAEFARFYGTMLDSLQMAYINGFGYKTARPVSPEDAPARFARAEEVFAGKLWREQLREWDDEAKPASIAIDRELQSIDPDALSEEELAAHLRRCAAHHAEMIYQHMRFTAAAVLPTGDFLAHVGDWTGLPHAQLLDLMRGASPVSAGASAELDELVSTLAEDPQARELLESDEDPATVLERLRSLERPAGAATNAYLELVGWRLLDGFDISEPCALELPDVLLRAIRIAVATAGGEAANVEEQVAKVRGEVPEERRAEFDELLAEARLMYRLRDERGVFSDIWASGLMRRAVLAAGRRLADAGRIAAPEHLIDAGLEEMCALLAGAGRPSAAELAARADYRASHSAKDVPQQIGDPPAPPPDPSGLPPAAGRVMRAMGVALGELFGGSEAEHEHDMLRGLAASRGVYEGPARRVAGPSEFGRIAQGDVLVTESTTEAFNILLPLLGAIVTDRGGLLSHSAIVAREYGIPGVVGTREATERIADGMRVRVDGDSGEVTVLG